MSNTTSHQESKSYKIKYIIVGTAGAGKSSLGDYYVNRKTVTPIKNITVYIDFFSKKVKINNKELTIHIWDTAGQERFSTVTRCYYRDPVGVFICFSLINRNSFDKLLTYYNDVQNINNRGASFTLVGTFLDKPKQRCINKEEAEKFAAKYKMKYIEISSKTGENIDECFETMNNIMCNRIDNFDSYIICDNEDASDNLDDMETDRMILYKCCQQ